MTTPVRATRLVASVVFLGLGLVSGCVRGGDEADSSGAGATQRLVERDVEAPEVFQTTDRGLWDGRPSLGGVWVAHPDTIDPERAVIRNEETGKFVIGALFRRERAAAGPALQVSSDAAEALGMLADEPASLNVTALRPEDSAQTAPAPVQAPLAERTTSIATEPASVVPPPQPSSLDKPFIQIGIFGQEANAKDTAVAFRDIGVAPTIKAQASSGKTFYRVIVGPAANEAERDALLAKVKDLGFLDAYFIGE